VDAARMATDQPDAAAKSEERSDEDDEEESEGSQSAHASKRNSLNFSNKAVPIFPEERTPTAGSLLAQAQAARPVSTQASVRRHAGPHDGGNMTVSSPTTPAPNFLAPSPPAHNANSIRMSPQFPSIEEAIGANSTSPEGVAAREVWSWFVDHLDSLLESIRSFRTDQFEMHLRQFWSSLTGNHREVVHAPAVAGLMAKADAILYDVRSG
jgi:regulatory factor X